MSNKSTEVKNGSDYRGNQKLKNYTATAGINVTKKQEVTGRKFLNEQQDIFNHFLRIFH
jgi:hypothetical protein